MNHHVELSVPATSDFLSLARLHVGAIATRMDVTVEELEGLQLAVEELCLSLLRPRASHANRLEIGIAWDDRLIEVHCRLLGSNLEGPPLSTTDGLPAALSARILDALVDEHGASIADGVPGAWLRARWGRRLPLA